MRVQQRQKQHTHTHTPSTLHNKVQAGHQGSSPALLFSTLRVLSNGRLWSNRGHGMTANLSIRHGESNSHGMVCVRTC